ncbi:MAG: hypothetical protein Q7S58_17135 [Candidatus Binatus sp.]|uniref:hypothetical protein n=1 Tax=Candidatus Binatus sp. TaxID=2811406 RepID=UPI00271E28F9|nr:hypothetical protein [Candidatus Binatus sp.]MDO8434125.1 hypothetical protein [Candidatus Binatus sp.]
MKMAFTFDWTLKASDILTSLTIIVSVVALLTAWTKDRDSRTREQADRVRTAAAKTLVKLERWQGLQRSLYSELHPVYVETSEILSKRFDVVSARDYLWKRISAQRVHIASRVLDEGIETAYVDLFAYHPSVRSTFLEAVAKLKENEEVAASLLLRDTQAAVMSFEGKRAGYTTAMLGNALREAAFPIEQKLMQSSSQTLAPIRDELYALISSDDRDILKRSTGAAK